MGGSVVLGWCSHVSDGLENHAAVSVPLFDSVCCFTDPIILPGLDCLPLSPNDLEYRIHIFPYGE